MVTASRKQLDQAADIERILYSPATVGEFFWPGIEDQRWVTPPHLELINETIRDCFIDPIRVLLSTPPRHGKSLITSWALPLWYLLNFPERRVVHISYAERFAIKIGSRRVRDSLVQYGELFGVRVAGGGNAMVSDWKTEMRDPHTGKWRETEIGGMQSVGMGGPITGEGAMLLLVDDPLKNAEQAQSETIRENHKEFWDSTAMSRLEPHIASVVVIATRWHEDDLIGHIEATQKAQEEEGLTNIERWTTINLPAIAEAHDPIGREVGEALWPERYDLSALERIRNRSSAYWWAAMYLGSPKPEDGMYFRRSYFRYYERDGDDYIIFHTDDGPHRVSVTRRRLVMGVDTATKLKQSNDFTVVATLAVLPWGDILWWDLVNERLPVPDQWPLIKRLRLRHRPARLGIEDKDSGIGLIQHAEREGIRVEALGADSDKGARATPFATAYQDCHIWHPIDAPWLDLLESQLSGFPFGEHDDIVDAGSHAYSLAAPLIVSGMVKPPNIERILEATQTGDPERARNAGAPAQFLEGMNRGGGGLYD